MKKNQTLQYFEANSSITLIKANKIIQLPTYFKTMNKSKQRKIIYMIYEIYDPDYIHFTCNINKNGIYICMSYKLLYVTDSCSGMWKGTGIRGSKSLAFFEYLVLHPTHLNLPRQIRAAFTLTESPAVFSSICMTSL